MRQQILKGTGVALVTPFKEDYTIDYPAFEKLIRHVSEGGVDYLVINGTTGESPTLSWKEKLSLLQFTFEHNPAHLPVVFGHGGNDTLKLLSELKELQSMPVAALLSVTPYYNRPSQQGLIHHYSRLSDESPFPILLYNVPYRTATNMEASTTLSLASHANILGIKEASTDLGQALDIIAHRPDDFMVLAGDDQVTLPFISLGAAGVISVVANYLPKKFSDMVNHALIGEFEYARSLNREMVDIYRLMGKEGNPTSVKTALAALGICANVVRPPLERGSDQLLKEFKAINSKS
jgi:4-hydroxy-tetrahydrodipicolinate synthase